MSLNDRYVGQFVELFELNFSSIGGPVLFLTNSAGDISRDGVDYTSVPISADNISSVSRGVQPTPTIKVGNLSGILNAAIRATLDLVGGVITRTIVLYDDIDGMPIQPPDVLEVESSSRDSSVVSLTTTTQLGVSEITIPLETMTIETFPGLRKN